MRTRARAGAITTMVVTGLCGTYLLIRSRPGEADALPRWTCNTAHPPVADVPAALLAKAGFRDTADLQRFVGDNEAALLLTYSAVQSALRVAELMTFNCFSQRWKSQSGAQPGMAEARLTWRLESDGDRASAHSFELAEVTGNAGLAAAVRSCLEQNLLKDSFEVRRPSKQAFVRYNGVFPFHRKLRFSTDSGPGAAAQSRAPS
jgi:hypothetical protein